MQENREAAATELGYVFTFLLGVLLLTMFSLWIYDIETATRERWNEEAIDANMNDLSAAIERTDVASRIDNSSYAERVYWRATEADESQFTLELTDTSLILYDEQGELGSERSLSGTASAPHSGLINLAGVESIWVVYHNGSISIELDRPMF